MRKVSILLTVIVLSGLAMTINYCNSTLPENPSIALSSLTIEKYLELPEERVTIAEGSLIIAKEVFPDLNVSHYLGQIDNMVKMLRSKLTDLEKCNDPQRVLQVINDFLFNEEKMEFDADIDFLNEVLDTQKGNCLSLSTLYLVLTEKLQLPIYGVDVPSHVFVRYESEGTRFNIETTNFGSFFTDEDERVKSRISSEVIEKKLYLNSLSKKEFLSLLIGRRGCYFKESGDLHSALRDFSLAVSLLSTNLAARVNRAHTLEELMIYNKALLEYTHVLNLDPNQAMCHFFRGDIYKKLGLYDQALLDYSYALNIKPYESDFYVYRGLIHLLRDDNDSALRDFNQALSNDPSCEIALRERADFYEKTGKIEKALDDYDLMIDRYPDNPWGYIHKGKLLMDNNRYEEAIIYFSQFIKLEPDNDFAYTFRSECFRSLKRIDKAEADEAKARQLGQNHKEP